ncbi:hypothetical protein [Solimonas marina]|uniref:Uncharacterized protein n=1 Tax=Solimonas marina TaxID=2714601 RepID=A0A970BA32_9GAMM|nr:hypothetical protein [Solimonas marina]NKF22971.1 hypothetical protein [Solimonas marina]
MNERLIKQWAISEKLLSEAALQVKDSEAFTECMEFLSHNELGLALETLGAEGEHHQVNAEYWHLLKKAAEVMGLKEEVKEFRRKRLLAHTSAVQQGIQADGPASGGSAA